MHDGHMISIPSLRGQCEQPAPGTFEGSVCLAAYRFAEYFTGHADVGGSGGRRPNVLFLMVDSMDGQCGGAVCEGKRA